MPLKIALTVAITTSLVEIGDLFWNGPTLAADSAKVVYFWLVAGLLLRGHRTIGNWLLGTGINLVVFFYSCALGPDLRVQLGFMPVLLLPFMLFSSRQQYSKLTMATLPAVLFMLLELDDYQFPGIERIAVAPEYRYVVIGSTFAAMFLYAYLFLKNAHNANEQLKKNMELVRQKEELVSTLIESIPAMVYAKDLGGHYILTNRTFHESLGRTREEVLGRAHGELYPDYQHDCESSDRLALSSPKPVNLIETIATSRGELVYRTIKFPLRDTAGTAYAVCGITFDITEQIKTQRELQEKTEIFRQLTETVTEGFWIVKPDGFTQIYLSPAIAKIWERPLLEMWNDSTIWLNAVHSEDRERVQREMFSPEKAPNQLEFRIVCPSGKVKWIWDRVFYIRNEKGEVVSICGVATDVTEKKEAEKVIEEQRARIVSASKLSAIGEMAGGIAHEINNPLAIIHARAGQLREMILDNPKDLQSEIASAAERIESNALRISRIVKSLRMFSRDGEKEPFLVTNCELLLGEVLDLCREKFKNGGIDIRLNIEKSLPMIECRPVQMGQVLLNLLNNANDAVQSLPEKWVAIDVTQLGNDFVISVTDSGKGIRPEIRDKILQPFFTTKPFGEGTGLGLSISKGIIDAHGGTLTLDTDSPNTRFVIKLPRTQSGGRIEQLVV